MQTLRKVLGSRMHLLPAAAGLAAAALILFAPANASPSQTQPQTQIPRSQNQSPAQKPSPSALAYKFEVATIKLSQDKGMDGAMGFFPEHIYQARNMTLKSVIRQAYELPAGPEEMVYGAPKWLDTDRYYIEAKTDALVADGLKKLSPDLRRLTQNQMLQQLLADRLKLAIRREPRELPVYSLTVAKNGIKLSEAKPGDTYEKAFPYADKYAAPVKAGEIFMSTDGRINTMYAFGASMPTLASLLTTILQRTVQDSTGLTGNYDFTLKFCRNQFSSGSSPDGQTVPSAQDPCGVPTFFMAIQQQLGLKVESGKGPVEVIVIDHVQRPSEN